MPGARCSVRLHVLSLFLAPFLAVGLQTSPASGQITVMGEQLVATTLMSVMPQCPTATRPVILRRQVMGVAVGPTPGTFQETFFLQMQALPTITQGSVTGCINCNDGDRLVTYEKTISGEVVCTADSLEFIGSGAYIAHFHNPDGSESHQESGAVTMTVMITRNTPPLTGATIVTTENFEILPAVLTLTPPAATNTTGTHHTVTATVMFGTTPAAGVTVVFTVTGSVNTTGTCTTDDTGMCQFTYMGPPVPGSDVITAFADANNNGQQDAVVEPPAEATKTWLLPPTTPGHVTGGGKILAGAVTFGLEAKSDKKLKGGCNVVDRRTTPHTHVKCLTVDAFVQLDSERVFFSGRATVNGVQTDYRIDVEDHGEPGRDRDFFLIQTTSGYSAGGLLSEGNIQIHKK
jgi:hypothetical protein